MENWFEWWIPAFAGMTEVQPGMTEVQPGMTEVQPEMTEVQPGMTEVQPEMTEVQPGMTGAAGDDGGSQFREDERQSPSFLRKQEPSFLRKQESTRHWRGVEAGLVIVDAGCCGTRCFPG